MSLSDHLGIDHRQIVELLERKVVTAELFEEEKIVEVFDSEESKRRYCLCRNQLTAGREGKSRERLFGAPAQNWSIRRTALMEL